MAKQDARSILPRRLRANPRTVARGLRALKAERTRAKAAGCDFVFSVIVPVYNTAAYLEDCVQSVIAQSVGFSDIQLILVDDGSTDDSATICERYAREYPANVTFCSQANAGVSAARNLGLAQVRGLWVNFLDSDDLWSPNAFACALAFHAEHPDVRLVALRHWFFGAKNEAHALNYKFARDRVVDVLEASDFPQHSFSNAFVERALLEDVRFNPQLEVSEDFALVNEVLMDLGAYGICSKEAYLYRKRAAGDSAIDLSAQKPSYYEQTPRLCYQKLFFVSYRRFGRVLPYIQYCVMYDLQWRLRKPLPTFLGDEGTARYKQTLVDLLQQIDDDIIVAQRKMTPDQLLYALSLKHGIAMGSIVAAAHCTDGQLVWPGPSGDVVLCDFAKNPAELKVEFVEAHEDEILVEGHCLLYGPFVRPSLRLDFCLGSHCQEVAYLDRADRAEKVTFAEDAWHKLGFRVALPWDGTSERLCAHVTLSGTRLDAEFTFGGYVGLEASLAHTYWVHDGALWTMAGAGTIAVRKARPGDVARHEAALQVELLRSVSRAHTLVAWRALALEARFRRKREHKFVWLISDRPMKAGDNGEALFAYLCEHPLPNVEPVFALSRQSEDWDRLSAMGRVVEFASVEYRRVFLRANLVISSAANVWVNNAFGRRRRFIKDLYGFSFAFLQHGVTLHDVSGWLNRYNKNLSLFVTSAPEEYRSIVEGDYGYGPDVVKRTGFPRHDSLVAASREQAPQRVVYLMPTWRKELSYGSPDPKTDQYLPNPLFEESDYFRFFNGLLSDERLNAALAQRDYELRFVTHPLCAVEAHKFTPGPATKVFARYDYREAFVEGGLLVTDYSSVVFDFALLKKPVLYAQFDRDTFYHGHTYTPGYFDYERDGFGPVTATLEDTVSAIIEAIDADCKMPKRYRERVDAFFGEQPACRCAVLVDELLALSERSKA